MAIEPLVEAMPADLQTGPLVQIRPDGQIVLYIVENRQVVATFVMDGFQAGMFAAMLLQGARNAMEIRGLPEPAIPSPQGFPEAPPNQATVIGDEQTNSKTLLMTFGQAQVGFRFDTESLRMLVQALRAPGAEGRAH